MPKPRCATPRSAWRIRATCRRSTSAARTRRWRAPRRSNNRLLPAAEYKQRALELAAQVDDEDERKRLLDDLATL